MKAKFLMFLCVAALLSLFAFAACTEPGTGAYVMNNKAELSSLTVGTGVSKTTANAPDPISPAEFDDLDYDLTDEGVSTIYIKRDEDMTSAYLKPKASKEARVAWGIGDKTNRPVEFFDYRVPATYDNEAYIYIRVTSEDNTATNYYRFYVFQQKKGTTLSELYVDGKRAIKEGAAGSWNEPALESGTLGITIPGRTNAQITVEGNEATSTFRFARVAAGKKDTPKFSSTARMTFTDQDTLYVEVTAENGVDKAFYKFVVSVGRIANITKLSFDTLEVTGKGVSHGAWDRVLPGRFANADMPKDGWSVSVDLEDPGSTYEFQLMTGSPGAAAPTSGWGRPEKAVFNNNNWLVIKVVSQGGEKTRVRVWWEEVHDSKGQPVKNPDGSTEMTRHEETLPDGIMYYRVNVDLLAANFKRHPASNVYYYYKNPADVQEILTVVTEYNANGTPNKTETLDAGKGIKIDYASPSTFISDGEPGGGKPVAALTFELDRNVPGATYQWWESNSWYGGYGFDKDGRKCYNINDRSNKTQFNWEQGFVIDSDHHRQFDEKSNPSLFNGGNQQASYVVPGRPITGATQLTYTPPIDRKPIIAAFSYETHYYWVVVTNPQTGYKTTSARATIVSERNKARNHLIIDVNNDYKVAGSDIPLRFRNTEVFERKYDKFRIPFNTLPSVTSVQGGFDIRNYKILTAQAKFYLADGNDWIQNWTNGNLSFEDNTLVMNGQGDNKDIPFLQHGDVHPDGKLLGLFYNLTNNNATYDITSDVKEPAAGGLPDTTPTHITIEPSGDHTKGPNKDGYPALGPDGKASPSIIGGPPHGDLQGWFCGYVELVELRFEGPR